MRVGVGLRCRVGHYSIWILPLSPHLKEADVEERHSLAIRVRRIIVSVSERKSTDSYEFKLPTRG